VGECYNPDPDVARGHLVLADELAYTASDPDIIADAHMGHLITYTGVATHSHETLVWADRLVALDTSRNREDTVIAHSTAALASLHLGDISSARRHLRAGISGSEELQLPVARAQLRWMEATLAVWRGDFDEAERHHSLAARVHERTELYEAGSGLVAEMCRLREQGGSVDNWPGGADVRCADGNALGQIVQVAIQSMRSGPDARRAAAELLARPFPGGRMHIWTTLGHAVLLAHLCADHRLTESAPVLLRELEPYVDYIALIGHIGVVGPVALATARLHAVLGDEVGARENLARAEAIAMRAGGAPTVLRCRLLACQLSADRPDAASTARALAEDAQRLGMRTVAEAAHRLALAAQ
jgi:hypothetical protein